MTPKPCWQILSAGIIFLVASALRGQDSDNALRERYLDRAGRPSEVVFARVHETAAVPGSETYSWSVHFRFAFRSADVDALEKAEPVHTDCWLVRRREYTAAFRARPVWDGRAYLSDGRLIVAAYTPKGERAVGVVDDDGRVVISAGPDDTIPLLKLKTVRYNPFTGQLWQREPGGRIVEDESHYLPLELMGTQGELVRPEYHIERTGGSEFALIARCGEEEITLATCTLDATNAKRSAGYSPEVGPGCTLATNGPTTVFEVVGQIAADVLQTDRSDLVLKREVPSHSPAKPAVQIDGRFDEWRSLPGTADPPGDIPGYLDYNPDTDLVQFKVASDDEHLYFYTRVVGRHGNTAPGRDRYYYYVYIDADRDPTTGYLPTRDDDCYYGVALGDDCEAQFEFVGGRFVKTFFGFTGGSTERDVLAGQVALAPSWYSKRDAQGRIRDGYKVEYVRQGDEIKITEDFTEGTSDDIVIAISADGSECEMRAALSGFLRDKSGKPIIAAGQRIDLAVGVEASGQTHGNRRWGADSTAVIRGYLVGE
jgi:hypothetical protein